MSPSIVLGIAATWSLSSLPAQTTLQLVFFFWVFFQRRSRSWKSSRWSELVPTLTIPLRQVTAGSLPLGAYGITAGGGSPGELQGSTDRCQGGESVASVHASYSCSRLWGSSKHKETSCHRSYATECLIQAEYHSCPRAAHTWLARWSMLHTWRHLPHFVWFTFQTHILSHWCLLMCQNSG